MSRPWTVLERVSTSDGVLELRRRGDPERGEHADFLILQDGRVVMTSVEDLSERALGGLAAEWPEGRILIGGLGMGLTLREALDATKSSAQIRVCELNPVIEQWCRGPLAPLTGSALEDPRVRVEIADVTAAIERAAENPHERLDAILLDLYQGPPTRISPGDPLFGARALAQCRSALTRRGLLAVWSETRSPAFSRGLQKQGFRVEEKRVGRGRRHLLYLARPGKGATRGHGS